MASNDAQLQMIQTMLDKGRTHTQICDAMGLSQEELDELLASDQFTERTTDWTEAITDGAISPEQALAWADSMTGPAMQALEEILVNPKTPAATRLRASEQILSWRQELANRKAEGDRRIVYNVLIENETIQRMDNFLQIMQDATVQQALDSATQLMPNTTA